MTIDWSSIFMPETPMLELFVRGSVMYFAIFILLRIFRRQAGSVGMTDILIMVLIADAAQNGMANDYTSVTDGIFLVSTLVFWNFFIEWLGYHFPRIEKILHPGPRPLIRNGHMIRAHMREQYITEKELNTILREEGIEDIKQVKNAFLEGDGKISIIKK